MGVETETDEIGLRLRAAIRNSPLTQKEIAERTGLCPATISKYMRQQKRPSLDTFAELCRVLGVSSDAILGLPPDK